MKFRDIWLRDWHNRCWDLFGHVIAACVLPGSWWYQWTPDAALVLLWPYSMVTGRMADEANPLVLWHKNVHSMKWIAVAWLIFPDHPPYSYLLLHWFVHFGIDLCTHKRWNEKTA